MKRIGSPGSGERTYPQTTSTYSLNRVGEDIHSRRSRMSSEERAFLEAEDEADSAGGGSDGLDNSETANDKGPWRVYGLVDPRDRQIKWIDKTSIYFKDQLDIHWSDMVSYVQDCSILDENYIAWLKDMRREKVRPTLVERINTTYVDEKQANEAIDRYVFHCVYEGYGVPFNEMPENAQQRISAFIASQQGGDDFNAHVARVYALKDPRNDAVKWLGLTEKPLGEPREKGNRHVKKGQYKPESVNKFLHTYGSGGDALVDWLCGMADQKLYPKVVCIGDTSKKTFQAYLDAGIDLQHWPFLNPQYTSARIQEMMDSYPIDWADDYSFSEY